MEKEKWILYICYRNIKGTKNTMIKTKKDNFKKEKSIEKKTIDRERKKKSD